jgi:thiamine kinase-like enzyme
MTVGLAENSRHIGQLCSEFDLGQPLGTLVPVHGGFHHRMWRLDADAGRFAVKQLSPDAECSSPAVRSHFNSTEAAAAAFSEAGVPALVALCRDGQFLHVYDGTGYLVYPWTDAKARGKNDITSRQAGSVAGIMAKMHRAGVQVPGLSAAQYDIHSEDKILALVEWALQRNIRDAREMESRLPSMLEVVRLQSEAIRILSRHLVVSHGDLDHKNVLWSAKGEPVLIDWESVRWLNPTYELILEALDWSGITGNFSPRAFTEFLQNYRQAGGVMDSEAVDASINCVFGDWLNWLMYNVGRAMDTTSFMEHSVGSEQVDLAFSTLLRMERQLPRLLVIAKEQSSGEVLNV